VKTRHRFEWWAASGALSLLGRGSWRSGIARGERLGDLVARLGIRSRVARENLAASFPERPPAERERILAEHYRELGRVVSEYARLPELARAHDEWFAGASGEQHLEAVRALGRGAILMSGHFSNFELVAAWIARRHPMTLIVRPLSNPRVDAWISEQRRRAGFELVDADRGVKGVFAALRANHFVAMLADQDARRHGVFVPFLGRPASTPLGPARMSLQVGAPIVTGFAMRGRDRRLTLEIDPPILPDGDGEAAQLGLTAEHVRRLESRVRSRPESWFWLHRRWKTKPPFAAVEREA
jgi:KDO2-lipid IV(A) lauroyltransferase